MIFCSKCSRNNCCKAIYKLIEENSLFRFCH